MSFIVRAVGLALRETGDVTIGSGSSVWYSSVVRGDAAPVTIGNGSNVQDGAVLRTASGYLGSEAWPLIVGENVTIGHQAHLLSCTVEDEALIGMGASVLESCVIEKQAIVAAGAVVVPGTVVKAGELWGGNPARKLRDLKASESGFLPTSATHYSQLADEHRAECTALSRAINS